MLFIYFFFFMSLQFAGADVQPTSGNVTNEEVFSWDSGAEVLAAPDGKTKVKMIPLGIAELPLVSGHYKWNSELKETAVAPAKSYAAVFFTGHERAPPHFSPQRF